MVQRGKRKTSRSTHSVLGWVSGALIFSSHPIAAFAQPVPPYPVPLTGHTFTALEIGTFKACVNASVGSGARNRCATPIYQDCNAAHAFPDSTIAINDCTMRVHFAWNYMLNVTYFAVLAGETSATKDLIRGSQGLWMPSRKADCDAVYASNSGGTIRGPAFAGCMAETTRARFEWLLSFTLP